MLLQKIDLKVRYHPKNPKNFCKIFLDFLGIIIYGPKGSFLVIWSHFRWLFYQSGAKGITENRKNRFCQQFFKKYFWPLDGARSKFRWSEDLSWVKFSGEHKGLSIKKCVFWTMPSAWLSLVGTLNYEIGHFCNSDLNFK